MLKKHKQFITSCMLAVDLLVVCLSWLLSYFIRFHTGVIPVNKGIPPVSQYISLMLFVLIIWALIFKAMNSYKRMKSKSGFDEFCEVLKLSTVSVLVLIAATFFYREHSYSRTVMILFWLISPFLLTWAHALLKKGVLRLRERGFHVRNIIIVGAGNLGRSFAQKVNQHPEIGVKVLGFLTDHHKKVGQRFEGVDVLAHIDELNNCLKKFDPDELFIALPLGAHARLEKVLNTMDGESVDVKVIPDLYRFMRLNGGVEIFDGLPIINLTEGPLWGWNRFVKRVLDIVFSAIALILTLPIMGIISLLVKLTSKGPLLYKQERMGLDGKRFLMYKFRSMVFNAEEETGAVWAKKGDLRVTFVGKWLRKTSLDELPQFYNVLVGDMSFVGPRPERPVFVEEFKRSVSFYMLRHKMKAGITGWAQVNGWRGNTCMEKRLEYDLYYIENWSLLFDIKIMWLTLWKGFVSKNAY